MRCLVTGASGFIGQHLLPMLKVAGHDVYGLYNQNRLDAPGIKTKRVNLFNPHEVENILTSFKPEILVHLAWHTTPPSYQTSTFNMDWCTETFDLVRAFVDHGGRKVVVAGSCFEYDLSVPNYLIEDNIIYKSYTFYGVCKKATGDIIRALPLKDVSITWARVFYLYGPGERKTRLVPSIITTLLKSASAVCSHGAQVRDFLHVADVASAFVSLVGSDISGVVNVGSGEGITIKKIAETIATKLGKPNSVTFGAVIPPPDDPPTVISYNNRLKSIGWKPRYTMSSGLDNTIAWWKENGQ